MLTLIISKLLTTLFFLSLVSVIRHGYYAIKSVLKTTEENTEFYKINKTELLFLGLSIAYILTAIMTGVGL